MKLICIQSIKGGCGATTVVAHLASALQANGQNVLIMDLCPNNMLRLAMGMDWEDNNGWVHTINHNQEWFEACYQSQEGILFIPYGNDIKPSDNAYKQFISQKQFIAQFERLDIPQDSYVLLDCSSNTQTNYSDLFKQADAVIHVSNADAGAYASCQNIAWEQHHSLLINQFNPLLNLERDISDLFHATLQQHMIPVVIHRDETIREALAHKQTAIHCAPQGQANHDFKALTLWLKSKIGNVHVS